MPISPFRTAALAAAMLPALAAAAPLTLDQAIDLAVQRSAAVQAAQAGARGAAEATHAAGQLPDPMLSVGIDNLPLSGADRFSTARDPMTMKRLGISQEWLSSGKRQARRAAAQAQTDREASMALAAAADARLQAAWAFIDAYYAGQALRLGTVNERQAQEALETARARLAAAAANGPEVLALASAHGLAADEAAELRQLQAAAQIALLRWAGVQPEDLAPPALPTVTEPEFVAAHPAVVAARRDLELSSREAAVTRTMRTPNWTWALSYGQRSGHPDMVSFGVSIPLPVAPSQRQDRETAASLALVDKSEAALAEATRAASAEYQTLSGDARRLADRIMRYESAVVVPAQQRTAAALASYRANQGTLTALFEARHASLEAQRKLLALQRERARTEAQLAFKPLVASGATR